MIQPGTDAATTNKPASKLVLVRATSSEVAGARRKVAGLTVVERSLKQLRRMGYKIVVGSDGTVGLPQPLPAGVEVQFAQKASAVDELHRAIGGPPVVQADVVRPTNRDLSGGMQVTDEASRLRAEDAIFAELLRGDLGFVARHLNKPVSFRITRHLLCHLPFTPNQVTLGAGVIGLAGCALIATGHRWWAVLGFFLAHLQSVLDGCDGELARVRFQQSAIGEWLDTVVDDALNLCLVIAIGFGVGRGHHATFPIVVGLVTAAMLLTYNAVAYRELIRQGEGGEVLKVRWWFSRGADMKEIVAKGGGSLAFRLVTIVARRDFFVFAWFVLAALGLFVVIQVYASLIVLPSFAAAVGQLIVGAPRQKQAEPEAGQGQPPRGEGMDPAAPPQNTSSS